MKTQCSRKKDSEEGRDLYRLKLMMRDFLESSFKKWLKMWQNSATPSVVNGGGVLLKLLAVRDKFRK